MWIEMKLFDRLRSPAPPNLPARAQNGNDKVTSKLSGAGQKIRSQQASREKRRLQAGTQVPDELSYIPSFLRRTTRGRLWAPSSSRLYFIVLKCFRICIIKLSGRRVRLFLQSWIFLDLTGAQTGQLVRCAPPLLQLHSVSQRGQ